MVQDIVGDSVLAFVILMIMRGWEDFRNGVDKALGFVLHKNENLLVVVFII